MSKPGGFVDSARLMLAMNRREKAGLITKEHQKALHAMYYTLEDLSSYAALLKDKSPSLEHFLSSSYILLAKVRGSTFFEPEKYPRKSVKVAML